LEEINKITGKIGKLDTVTIGGGEPFSRRDLPEIIDLFEKNNGVSVVAIPTNCLSTENILADTEEILKRFKGQLKIGLSLDGIGETHDKIRGVEGNFKKFLETYRGLAELKKEYPKLRLRICSVILNANIKQIPEMIKYVKENLPMVNYHGLELLKGDYDRGKVKAVSPIEFQKIVEIIEEENKNERNFYKRVTSPIIQRLFLDILKEKKQLIPCRISSFYPMIDALGNVYPCEQREKIGNLRNFDYDLNKIWQSGKAKRIRESIRRKECYCTHSAYQAPNVYLSPKMVAKIIKGKY
jgi:MoaA/NifB/PqqE/SkfB family radical SAM enzyme